MGRTKPQTNPQGTTSGESSTPAGQSNANAARPANRKPTILKSGNAGSSKPSTQAPQSGETTPQNNERQLLFTVGYKTPLALLYERCQREGWEKPLVEPHRTSGGGWTCVVTIRRKAKGSSSLDSVVLRPPTDKESPINVNMATLNEAKHWGAMYALFRFANNLRLNLTLPPECRSYWANLEQEKKTTPPNKQWLWSPDPFGAAASAPPSVQERRNAPRQANNNNRSSPSSSTPSSFISTTPSTSSTSSKPASLPKWWQEAPEVRMPQSLRDLVETTIRNLMTVFPDAVQSPGLSDDRAIIDQTDTTSTSTWTDPEGEKVTNELVEAGFRPGHVESALSYIQSARNQSTSSASRKDALSHSLSNLPLQRAVIEYLLMYLPEDDLPPSYRRNKPADSGARIADASSAESLALSWTASKISDLSGFPINIVEGALKDAGGDEAFGVGILMRRLVGWSEDEEFGERGLREKVEETTGGDGIADRHEDELLALESILGERFERHGQMVDLHIDPEQAESAPRIFLRAYLTATYPSPSTSDSDSDSDSGLSLPTFYVGSSELPSYIRLHLTARILEQFRLPDRQDWRDMLENGGVLLEMLDYLSGIVKEVLLRPPPSKTVFRFLLGDSTSGARSGESVRSVGRGLGKRSRNTRHGPPKHVKATPADHLALESLYRSRTSSQPFREILAKRQTLPAWSMKDKLVSIIGSNRVVVVAGETGSGKTTQIPSFVLETELQGGRGGDCSIIVTQPRRVSAISVATRVAQELGEDIGKIGDASLVGYAIRGERKAARGCRLLFCTTGVLLRRLAVGDKDLANVSHVFVDEVRIPAFLHEGEADLGMQVHERSVDSDILLLELKNLLLRNKRIKVVLMSATVDLQLFSGYYGGAPSIQIPGLTHPVQDFYLEDVINLTKHRTSGGRATSKMSQAELDAMRKSIEGHGVREFEAVNTVMSLTRSEVIDYTLLGATVSYLLDQSDDKAGAVLVFTTGVAEIRRAIDAINEASGSKKVQTLPLHANLTTQEQNLVFQPPRKGFRKVVVATNVAETSITIPDVVYVVDTGRVKEIVFDPATGLTKLEETYVSKAAARQRRGRAGRTQPGQCYKLFSHWTETNRMNDHPIPEILRTPLDMVALQVKAADETANIPEYLSKTLSPPDLKAVDQAIGTLRSVGALDGDGGKQSRLTPLGQHLSLLPMDLRLGKMLILATFFRCLDPILTIAALLSSKPLFASPPEKRDEAKTARERFFTGNSDLLTDLNACSQFAQIKGMGNARRFCEENFISFGTVREVGLLRRDLLSSLSSAGFLPFPTSTFNEDQSDRHVTLSEFGSDENLVKSIVFAGLGMERLVKVRMPAGKFETVAAGTVQIDNEAKEVRFFDQEGRVFVHPSSTMFSQTKFASSFLTFFSKNVTTKPFLRDVTEVPTYGLLLFGGPIRVDLRYGGLAVRSTRIEEDEGREWIRLRAWPRIGVLMNQLRVFLEAELAEAIEEPGLITSEPSDLVSTLRTLLHVGSGLR